MPRGEERRANAQRGCRWVDGFCLWVSGVVSGVESGTGVNFRGAKETTPPSPLGDRLRSLDGNKHNYAPYTKHIVARLGGVTASLWYHSEN